MRRRSFVIGLVAAAAPSLTLAQTGGNPQGGNTARRAQALENPIVPETDLERTFLAAFSDESMRTAFRRQLLESQIVLALANNAPDAPPLERDLPNNNRAAFIFTSLARAEAVMGPAAPRRLMTGRAALERLRGKYLIVNYSLEPMLTLEPDDIERFLAMPRTGVPSAGPSQ
ncbi:MAG: hypothetical protein AB7T59_09055 [Hyphomonadaceae bacterium]